MKNEEENNKIISLILAKLYTNMFEEVLYNCLLKFQALA